MVKKDMSAVNGENVEKLVKDGKNVKTMKCSRCPSLVLDTNIATLEKTDLFLPFIRQKKEKEESSPEGETLHEFWVVDDMYQFENVGFTNTVDNTKYLTCADCEMGPIGLYDISSKKCFVAVNRVEYV